MGGDLLVGSAVLGILRRVALKVSRLCISLGTVFDETDIEHAKRRSHT